MADEKQISPEEKLLRVIQGKKGDNPGGATPPAPAPASPPAASAAAAAKPVKAASDEDVIADVEEPQPAPEAAAEAPTAPVTPEPEQEAAKVAAPRIVKLRRADDPVIQRANRLLMVAAVLIAVLIGFQIWANVTSRPLPEAIPGDVMLPQEPTDAALAPVEEYVKLFEAPPWMPPTDTIKTSTNQPLPDTQTLIRQAVRLVAVSQVNEGVWEAIVVDNSTGRMHFLRAGGRMMAGEKGKEKELTLVKAERDHAVLSDGKEEFVLK